MKLTQKQQILIKRYMGEVATQLDAEAPEKARDKALDQLQRRIQKELEALGQEVPGETEVLSVLRQLGTPQQRAEAIMAKLPKAEGGATDADNRVWLGVCANVAREYGVDLRLVRLGAVLAGCITGPLAVITYIGAFFLFRPKEDAAKIQWGLVIWRPVSAFIIVMLLHHGVRYAIGFIPVLYEKYLGRALPALGDWGWLPLEMTSLRFWALALTVPLAVLSALPLANAWDYTLKRVMQALLALYGLVLCFGIASYLVGIILDVVSDFAH